MYCPDYEESEKYVYYYANMGTGTEGEFVVFKYFGYHTGSSNVGGQGHNTIKLPYKLDAKPDFNVYIEDDEFRPFLGDFWEGTTSTDTVTSTNYAQYTYSNSIFSSVEIGGKTWTPEYYPTGDYSISG